MDSKVKLGLSVLGVLGVLGLARYFHRQGKALKNLCITNVSWNWTESIKAALATGTIPDDAKVELKATNTSDIELTVNEFLLELRVDDKHIGFVKTFEKTVIPKNSSRNIYAIIEFDVDVNINLALDIIDIILDPDPTEFRIEGYINVSASIMESYSHKFDLLTTKDTVLSQVSGDCDL